MFWHVHGGAGVSRFTSGVTVPYGAGAGIGVARSSYCRRRYPPIRRRIWCWCGGVFVVHADVVLVLASFGLLTCAGARRFIAVFSVCRACCRCAGIGLGMFVDVLGAVMSECSSYSGQCAGGGMFVVLGVSVLVAVLACSLHLLLFCWCRYWHVH